MEFKLIIKKLNQALTLQEATIFKQWYEKSVLHRNYFDKVNANYHNDLDDIDVLEAWKKLEIKIEGGNKKSYLKYAIAASALVLISISFFKTKNSTSPNDNNIIVNNSIEVGTDKATLTLSDGSLVVLEKGDTYKTKNINSNGEQLVYNSYNDNTSSEITYNYLTIPRGGQFFIKLSDGTQVWLNSESQLKYPVSFIDGKLRQVELIYGEAYFDVSPSTKHKESIFKVLTDNQEIEVLGTEFNIKAYQDENIIYTTLIEGSVSVKNNDSAEILKPSEQSILDVSSNTIAIKEVNIENEISWIHGEFVFYKKPLKEIMKVFSRWYDVTIVFEDKSLEKIEFNGELGKSQKIEDILELIKQTKTIKAYEINNNTIILK